ncbi:TPA: efflux RND transporter periplasmic adaptor subunit [Candidatus Poribacteria bacterium]|nr:efflux RND transporter periplasmic adaptor subunit [Candidatus Poribacteria bacterium]
MSIQIMMRGNYISYFIILFIWFGIGCQKPGELSSKNQAESGSVTENVKPVEVTKVEKGNIQSELELSGSIKANSQVVVVSQVVGEIIEVLVSEGQFVTKGEVVAVIESEELKLRLLQAQAAYHAAEIKYTQAQKLAKIRISAQVAQARSQLSAAETELQQVLDLSQKQTLSKIEQAEAGLASLQANFEKIRGGTREEDKKRAQAAVDQAKANLTNIQSNYNRMRPLFDDGAISAQSFDNVQAQLGISKAQYDAVIEQKKLIDRGPQEEDIRAVGAQVKQAEAAVRLARLSNETKTWEKDISLMQSQVESARANLQSVEALENAKSWEAEIASAETLVIQAQASADLAKKMLSYATIIAPIAGIISKLNLDPGNIVTPAVSICEIVDMHSVKAVVYVIESDLPKVEVGREVSINVDSWDEPFSGRISEISPVLDISSRSAKVEIVLSNPDLRLKPGMFSKVTIPLQIRKGAIILSRSAIIRSVVSGEYSVFIIDSGISKQRQIGLGLSKGDIVEIRSGLSSGEQVVTAGQHSLRDGDKVKIVNR